VSFTVPAAAQTPYAARLLAEMRDAIGAPALASLQGFSIKGREVKNFGTVAGKRESEWVYAAPDRFIHASASGSLTDTTGFNGDSLIYLRGRKSGRGMPPRQNPSLPHSLDIIVLANKRAFASFVLPLLGITPVYPYSAAYAGEDTVDKRPVHILTLADGRGTSLRFSIDAVTHLPVMLSWMAKREFVVPDPPDSENMPLVEHRLYYTDFSVTDGVKWPRRIKEMVGDRLLVDTEFAKVRINPPIEPHRFVTVPRDR